MNILTLNINSIRAHAVSFMDILRSGAYDTIVVQELKVETASFPHNLFDEFGYNIKVFGQKSWNGVAVFSKHSIEDVIFGLPGYPDTNSRFIECLIDGRVRLINVYMPNGDSIDSLKFTYKLEWMNAFTNYIKQYIDSEEMVVITGDFNVAINDSDVWAPKSYVGSSISAPAAREIMQGWLDSGWLDAWKHFNPDAIGYTWFGYRGFNNLEKNQGLRLDYFLVNRAAAAEIRGCFVDFAPRKADKPTDHTGLALKIN